MKTVGLPFKAINPNLRKYGSAVRGKVLIVEGLISAGKSTAGIEIHAYVQELGIPCKFFPEPLIPELLELFLSDQKKYAFSFQLTMLVKRQAIYREAHKYAMQGYFCIIDRSLYGDYCFALMHKNRGNISETPSLNSSIDSEVPSEWKSYLSVLHSEEFEHPDYVIYLEVSADTAIKRCIQRDRKGEKKYDRAYFQELCDVYRNVIPASPAKNFLVVDWNEDRIVGEIAVPLLNEVKKLYDNNSM
jgi:deoxyadenosine/deoxycytidine kinase